MHDLEKSDSAVVAVKSPNKAGSPAAEAVEPRAGTKGNADQQSTHRTQTRERVTQALNRVRQAARQRKKERFTALLHHVNVDTLLTAFYALKRKAAAGVDGVTWQDYEADLGRNLENLHGRVRSPGSVSAATISPDVHTEGGRPAKTAGDRGSGRQGRPGCMRHCAQRHLRRGFPRVLIWVPTWTRAAGCVGCSGGGDHQSEGESHT